MHSVLFSPPDVLGVCELQTHADYLTFPKSGGKIISHHNPEM